MKLSVVDFRSPEYPEYEHAKFERDAQRNVEEAKSTGDDVFLVARVTSALTDRRWLTVAGNYVYPEDMTNEHLTRAANMLAEGRNKRPGCSGRSNAQWLEIFKNELARRGLLDKLVYVKEEAQKT